MATKPKTETNGHEPESVAGPQLKRLEDWYDLDPQEFPGFQVRLWLGFSQEDWETLTEVPQFSEDMTREEIKQRREESEERKRTVLRKIVRAHNGWREENGDPFPDALDTDFYRRIPTRLASVILSCIQTQVYAPPKSRQQTRPR